MQRRLFVIFFICIGLSTATSAQTYRAWVNAANKALEERHYAEAISHFMKASEFEVEDQEVFYNTAEAFRLYNDYDRAAAWYTKVVLDDKENRFPLALFYLAEMRKYIGQYPESKQLYEKYASLHAGDTTYFVAKARFEAQSMAESIRISDTLSNIKVDNAGSPINSVYSDFAGAYSADSSYYYSSLRFLYENTEEKKQGYYVTRILKTPLKQPAPAPLGMTVNLPELHNSNMAISPDGKVMVFARCPESGNYRLQCELFESRNESGVWSKPVKIQGKVNTSGYTSTQPALTTRGADGYKLYFVSDRPGGIGRSDIWVSERDMNGNYSEPVNIGPPVNTFDEESTPWFDANAQELYFSSYGHPGMGGLDIFRSRYEGSGFADPVNLLPPVNSSANDIYFSKSADTTAGSFSSNRKGSMFISSQTCCYDIYFLQIPLPDTTQELTDTAVTVAAMPENLYERKSYDDFLPLVLYFENDQPDPRTRKETTQSDYLSLYQSYLDNRPEYLSQFTKGLTGDAKEKAASEIEYFFDMEVIAAFKRLEGFCAKLERAMEDSVQLTLEVRGRASPLAKTDYNEILSKRRISSLVNYLVIYRNGSLKPYLDSGQLVVKEVPAGESMAGTGISDELKDQRNSVYNPAAAIERRIELINVVIKNPR